MAQWWAVSTIGIDSEQVTRGNSSCSNLEAPPVFLEEQGAGVIGRMVEPTASGGDTSETTTPLAPGVWQIPSYVGDLEALPRYLGKFVGRNAPASLADQHRALQVMGGSHARVREVSSLPTHLPWAPSDAVRIRQAAYARSTVERHWQGDYLTNQADVHPGTSH